MIVALVWSSTDHVAPVADVTIPSSGTIKFFLTLEWLSGPELVGRPWAGDPATVKIDSLEIPCVVDDLEDLNPMQESGPESTVRLTYALTAVGYQHSGGVQGNFRVEAGEVRYASAHFTQAEDPNAALRSLLIVALGST